MRDHLIALAVATAVLVGLVALARALDVSYRQSGRVALVALTPGTIGDATSRVELFFQNNGANDICCGYPDDTLNCTTPGPHNGAKYSPQQGLVRCVFPDKPFRCVDAVGGSIVSWDEARMVTATPTATATATNTP